MPSEAERPHNDVIWHLTERLKELTALHATARLIHDDRQPVQHLLDNVLNLLPPAWQFPDVTEARIEVAGACAQTDGWRQTPWTMRSPFALSTGEAGTLEVAYTEARPPAAEGPFLAEERALIDSIAEMLRRWFQHRAGDEALDRARQDLERQVEERTAELSTANAALRREVEEHRAARVAVEQHQQQLREMANALCLTGEQERRVIAQSLHDHIGQSLAFTRMRLSDLRGNAVFCGFEDDLGKVLQLLDGALRYTRDLTCKLSPPRLYELGLDAALEWLVERTGEQHGLVLRYSGADAPVDLEEGAQVILYATARELLANAVRHGRPTTVAVDFEVRPDEVRLRVRDDGCGFDPEAARGAPCTNRFGLFSVRERLRSVHGRLDLVSAPGAGTEAVATLPRPGGTP